MILSSEKITNGIRVTAVAQYIEEESNPAENRYFFAYRIMIENVGEEIVQLMSRHWYIINSEGDQREVKGEGVVGKKPQLVPGKQFEYISGCPLDTEWGTMEGYYEMRNQFGEKFRVDIGRFYLTLTEAEAITPA